jgi:hypothetical protein
LIGSSGENDGTPDNGAYTTITLLAALIFIDPYCERGIVRRLRVSPIGAESEVQGTEQNTAQDHCSRDDAAITQECHGGHHEVYKDARTARSRVTVNE